jgi:CheY-like chemotaxis protein
MKTQSDTPGSADQRILLVDDVPQGTIARKSVLMSLGYQVHTAESGQQALDILERLSFDVMVTDFRMPGMDGLELIRRVKVLYPGMRIVLLSALADALGYTAESTGADTVLAKSNTELNQLTRAIAKLLARKPVRKPAASQRKPPLFMVKSS